MGRTSAGVMCRTSAGLTWPVRTHAGAWNDCYDKPCKHKEFNRHLWTRLWPAYYKCDVDQGHHGMTMRHNQSYTAQPERKLNWLCNGRRKCVTEGGGLWKNKTVPSSLPLWAALNYKRLFTLINFTPYEELNGFKEAHMNRAAKSSSTTSW